MKGLLLYVLILFALLFVVGFTAGEQYGKYLYDKRTCFEGDILLHDDSLYVCKEPTLWTLERN